MAESSPKIMVIIPVFDTEKFLGRQSLLPALDRPFPLAEKRE